MKWIKEREPWRAELIKDCNLESEGKLVISANKDNPVLGTVTHYGYKKIGRNNVCMCSFSPDVAPNKSYTLSRKWLRKIKKQ